MSQRLQDPEALIFTGKEGQATRLTRARDRSNSGRTPPGHPEGYLEAFANIYRDFADAITASRGRAELVPDISEGVRGMAFVERAVAASRAGEGWVTLEGDAR